jgi:hypothetical protein
VSSPGAKNVITRLVRVIHERARDIWICMTGVNLDCPNKSGNDIRLVGQ